MPLSANQKTNPAFNTQPNPLFCGNRKYSALFSWQIWRFSSAFTSLDPSSQTKVGLSKAAI
jgi:hypothetical protein